MYLRYAIAAACIVTAWLPAVQASDDFKLTAAASDTPLIFPGAGEKSLQVTFSVPIADSPLTTLKAEVRGYNGSVERVPKVLTTTETPVTSRALGGRDLTCNAVLPRLGLFEVTVTALDSAKHPVASLPFVCAAVPPRTSVGPTDFGVCAHLGGGGPDKTDYIAKTLDLLKLAGFSRVRTDLPWDHIERSAGIYSFAPVYNDFVRLSHERGISPLIVLAYANGAVYPMKSGFPDQPQTRAAFARYASELAKHYGETVRDWEVWNEPQAWGKPTVENYTLLLKETYRAIKAVSSSANVISCGGGGAGGGPGGDYIASVIHAGGLDSQDGFSIHPYISPPGLPDSGYETQDSVIPRVNLPVVWPHLAQFIASNHKTDGKPLDMWVTELGCYSSPIPWFKGEPFQAVYFTRAFLLSRRYGTAKAVFWYDFRDGGANPQDFEQNFGLIRQDNSPKPAYVAASVLTWTLGNRPWKKALVENADASVFQFGDDSDSVIAGWQVQRFWNESVVVKVPRGTYLLRDWQGADKEVEIDDNGYRWKLGPLPQYLLPKSASLQP